MRYAQPVLLTVLNSQATEAAQPPFGGMAIEFESESGSAQPLPPSFLANPATDLLKSVGPVILILLVTSILVRAWSRRSAAKPLRRNPWRRPRASPSSNDEQRPIEPMTEATRADSIGTTPEDALRTLRERAP